MAVFLAASSREIVSKIIAIWFPVMCFVGLGTDHVIANMYFIPLAIFLGSPKPLTVGYYIWKSMIPSLLGNIIGGGLFTGVVYWYLFLAGNDVEIHFDTMPMDHPVCSCQGYGHSNGSVKEGHSHMIPSSGNVGMSGLAKDLHGEHFKKNSTSSETTA